MWLNAINECIKIRIRTDVHLSNANNIVTDRFVLEYIFWLTEPEHRVDVIHTTQQCSAINFKRGSKAAFSGNASSGCRPLCAMGVKNRTMDHLSKRVIQWRF